MALQISYVERFEDVVGPTVEFLSRERDLFAKPRIVVPNAGAKAWLWSELARELGATVGPGSKGRGDGIVANVEISYPGTIVSLLQPVSGREVDPWSFDRLTFTVLEVLAGEAVKSLNIPFDVTSEPLLAARRIAGLFDEYHVRRPEMICEWSRGTTNRVFNPTANDEQKGGIPVAESLPDSDTWQFELWKLVHARIGMASPPERASLSHRLHDIPLLVAGLQSLSWPQLKALQELSTVCDVDALLVHPSPGLRAEWHANGPPPLEAKLLGRPLRRSRRKPGEEVAADDDAPSLPDGFDPLPSVWLKGAQELQGLVTSQAVSVVERSPASERPIASLLHHLQHTIATGRLPVPRDFNPADDHSVTIHRCHSLSRQAEVLHEALLHAFADPKLTGLQPHDVVIVSPCLEEAAPHLEAAFQHTLVERNGAGKEVHRVRLPLVVADRGIRETSESVDLLTKLLVLPGARCSVDDVLAVAGHPLVRSHLGTNEETEATWLDLIERTQVRWGLDAEHRRHRGLTIADATLRDVHTWKSGLEQMLLGVTLPDDTRRRELGGVVPLTDLDPADVESITKLIRVLDVVGGLASITATPQPADVWCDAIETALVGLCGENCRQLAEPLAQIRRLREAATGATADRKVSFEEVRTLLAEWFDEKAGRQPLRTGAITATSMVPLRSVPFRVVCVIGYDDGVVKAADPQKDDLVARMPLVGDSDPLTDTRRALLDCLLAARDRLVIATTGRDVRSNEEIALVTPLAELVDFAVRHGVSREKLGEASAIEIEHPRHHLSPRNFHVGAIQRGVIWSHDALAAKVAEEALETTRGGKHHMAGGTARGGPDDTAAAQGKRQQESSPATHDIDLSILERMVKDPLELYLKENYGISTWRDDDAPTAATLPLALDKSPARNMTLELLDVLLSDPAEVAAWKQAALASGRLPPGPHGRRQLREIELLAEGLRDGLREHQLDFRSRMPKSLDTIDLGDCRVVGQVNDYEPLQKQFVFVFPKEIKKTTWGRPMHTAALRLLAARAAGIDVVQATIIGRRDRWTPGKKAPTRRDPDRRMKAWQPRVVRLSNALMPEEAARRRLREIAGLAQEAIAKTRPAFRDVITSEGVARVRAFGEHVRSEFYSNSAEAMVFGVSPSFDEVFHKSDERTRFLDDFKRCLQPEYVDADDVYELS